MISALITTYHLVDSTVRAVKSLLPEVQGDEAIEIILVDNSESAELSEQLRQAVGDVCNVIIAERNLGFGGACNLAYQHAKGDYILLLNPDAWYAPGAVKAMREFLQNNPTVGAVGPRIYWDETRRFLLPASIIPDHRQAVINAPHGRTGGFFTWRKSLQDRQEAITYWTTKTPIKQIGLSGGHAMMTREALDCAGGLFDPRFFMYHEDTDLSVRLTEAGYDSWLVPDAIVTHAFASTPLPESWKQEQIQTSYKQFMEKYDSQPDSMTRVMKWLQYGKPWLPQIQELGALETPPVLDVPSAIQGNWLLECSVSPFFMPSAALFGQGAQATISPETWAVMSAGQYYLRLGAPDQFSLPPAVVRFQR